MPKFSPIQNSFVSGELSPLLLGRSDFERYKRGVATCTNFVPIVQGPATRRSGTRFVGEVKDSTKHSRLVKFSDSFIQDYLLEIGDFYIRFWKDDVLVLVGAGPAIREVVTPYPESQIDALIFSQDSTTLYIAHPNHPTRYLKVIKPDTVPATFEFDTLDLIDGPYLLQNKTSTTLNIPSNVVGATHTVTASSIIGINDNQGFLVSDIGRLIRIKRIEGDLTYWGYLLILTYISTTQVTATLLTSLGTTPVAVTTTEWRLGLYSGTTGYARAVTIHEDRLALLGSLSFPSKINLSVNGDYTNFSPTKNVNKLQSTALAAQDNGLVTADSAIDAQINGDELNTIFWGVSTDKGLVLGTESGPGVIAASILDSGLTAIKEGGNAGFRTYLSSKDGCSDVEGLRVGPSVIYTQNSELKVRELTYTEDIYTFRSIDLTVLSEHITQSGVRFLAYQAEPHSLVWMVKANGELLALTYDHDGEEIRAGWSRQILGGRSDNAASIPEAESIAVLNSPDKRFGKVYVEVKRQVGVSIKRYIEYFENFFANDTDQEDGYFVDCGITHNIPFFITAVTSGASPAIFTVSANHGFAVNDKVLLEKLKGLVVLNGEDMLINSTPGLNTFTLKTLAGAPFINQPPLSPYVSGGEVRKYVSTVSGLSHLNSETVNVLADGQVQTDKVVTAGAITLDIPATTIHVGFHYHSDLKLLRFDGGAATGTSIGRTRRIHRVDIQVWRSLGLMIGMDFDNLTEVNFRNSSTTDQLDRAQDLFTGIFGETIEADYDTENQICIRQDKPLPCTILSVSPQMNVEER